MLIDVAIAKGTAQRATYMIHTLHHCEKRRKKINR